MKAVNQEALRKCNQLIEFLGRAKELADSGDDVLEEIQATLIVNKGLVLELKSMFE
ncbi:hypothetical protein QYZ44_26720 [Vibrio parahaemolyticus]|nr:hypothetical protein [Vibrio parahaemolyticus]MDN4712311.1 hypothetical protein [Vibrio parahaemolyticus]